jgi:hypothetical protein
MQENFIRTLLFYLRVAVLLRHPATLPLGNFLRRLGAGYKSMLERITDILAAKDTM